MHSFVNSGSFTDFIKSIASSEYKPYFFLFFKVFNMKIKIALCQINVVDNKEKNIENATSMI